MKLNTPDLIGSRIIVCDTLVPLRCQSRKRNLSSNTIDIDVIEVQQKLIFQFREVGNRVNYICNLELLILIIKPAQQHNLLVSKMDKVL